MLLVTIERSGRMRIRFDRYRIGYTVGHDPAPANAQGRRRGEPFRSATKRDTAGRTESYLLERRRECPEGWQTTRGFSREKFESRQSHVESDETTK